MHYCSILVAAFVITKAVASGVSSGVENNDDNVGRSRALHINALPERLSRRNGLKDEDSAPPARPKVLSRHENGQTNPDGGGPDNGTPPARPKVLSRHENGQTNQGDRDSLEQKLAGRGLDSTRNEEEVGSPFEHLRNFGSRTTSLTKRRLARSKMSLEN